MSSGVSVGARSGDTALENLALIMADPATFQDRINSLQKATLEASEAWARLRTAETADAMMKDAEAKFLQAKEVLSAEEEQAKTAVASAKKEASEILDENSRVYVLNR